jgi:hypothetical protein
MNQLTALALAAMMVTAGGAVAVSGTPGATAAANDDGVVTDAEIDAAYDAPSVNESTNETAPSERISPSLKNRHVRPPSNRPSNSQKGPIPGRSLACRSV